MRTHVTVSGTAAPRRTVTIVSIAAAALVTGVVHGAPPQVTYRAASDLVVVDAIVTDDDGRFVDDLTAEDFEIFEDGIPQRVELLYLVPGDWAVIAGDNGHGTAAGVERRGRHFIFMFDLAHLSNESLQRARTGLERFINTEFRPDKDYAGIYAAGAMPSGLTSDKVALLAALHGLTPAFDNRERRVGDLTEYPAIPSENDALRIQSGDAVLLQTLIDVACAEAPHYCTTDGGIDDLRFKLLQKAGLCIEEARAATGDTFRQLDTLTRKLPAWEVQSRKILVLFSDGFLMTEGRSEGLHAIAAMAALSQTAIYPVYGRGTSVIGGQTMQEAVRQRPGPDATFDDGDRGLQILAAGTGGFIVRYQNDISLAVSQIARDADNHYILGYQPTNRAMDGSVRRIEVKTTVGGLSVRARTAYLAVRR